MTLGMTVGTEGAEEREGHRALELVARDVVPSDGDEERWADHPVPRSLGLPTFDEVAVVDHVGPVPRIVAASGPLVARAVALEGVTGDGPSCQAVASGETVVVRDLEHERRWSAFVDAAAAQELPLRRWVVVPLAVPDETALGSIVVVATDPGVVAPGDLAAVGGLVDRSTLRLLAHVAAGREARAVVALDSVRLVAMAVGVAMGTEGLTEAQALRALRSRSRRTGSRLVDAAVRQLTEQGMSFR